MSKLYKKKKHIYGDKRPKSAHKIMYKGHNLAIEEEPSVSMDSVLHYSDDEAFRKEDYKYEALERNGKQLPRDFVLANLSTKKKHKVFYFRNKEIRKAKDHIRLNSAQCFARADMYNRSQSSFN